jgi:hypothetical protein
MAIAKPLWSTTCHVCGAKYKTDKGLAAHRARPPVACLAKGRALNNTMLKLTTNDAVAEELIWQAVAVGRTPADLASGIVADVIGKVRAARLGKVKKKL